MSSISKTTTLFLLCLMSASGLSAQINLKAKAKDLVKEKSATAEQQKTTPAPEKPAPATSEPRSAPAAKPSENPRGAAQTPRSKPGKDAKYQPSVVDLDFESEPFAPSIVWASLLSENAWYFNITTGQMKVNNLLVSFLPKKDKSGAPVQYESYHNETPLLRMEVWDTKNNVLKETMHYEASPATAPFYDMEVIEGYDYKSYTTLTEGSYELRFWAGIKHFYTFPFSVEKLNNPDPYAPVHDFYFLKGPWQDWGRVEFGPDGHFIFNWYMTHQTTTIVNQAQWDAKREYKFLVKLYRDGKMVAARSLSNGAGGGFEEGDIQTHNGKWQRYDCTFHKYPVAKPGARDFFMKADMKDGDYTAEVALKSLDGVESAYKYGFTVKNGAVVTAPEADRAVNTNPLLFLEQGPGRFYVKKR